MQRMMITVVMLSMMVLPTVVSAMNLRSGSTRTGFAGRVEDRFVSEFSRDAHDLGFKVNRTSLDSNRTGLDPLIHASDPGNFKKPYAISKKRCPTGRMYVGCVMDSQTKAQIWYKDHVPKTDRVAMSPQVCYDFCWQVAGVSFFGLRRGDECYCTPFFHNTDKGNHGECDQPCSADNSQMCGGVNMISIYEMHDCDNLPAVPCKKLPQVKFATTFKSRYYRKSPVPCANVANKPLTTQDQLCHVECIRGYELIENTLKCQEKGDRLTYSWAQMQGTAVCAPVNCGSPPDTKHTRHTNQAIVYPQKTTYTCQLGYEIREEGKPFRLMEPTWCIHDATFNVTPSCTPVICGGCPTGAKYAHSTPRNPEEIRVFGKQCTYDCGTGYTLDRQAAGVAAYDIRCMATREFQEPQQCKPVLCGPPLDHEHAQLETPTAETAVVFPEVVKYQCKLGHSLTGVFGEKIKYSVTCQANGMFSKAPYCRGVTCGLPPAVGHSTFGMKELHYLENVTYFCHNGYTVGGKASDPDNDLMTCGPIGKYVYGHGQDKSSKPRCEPVVCGEPPIFQHTHGLTTGVKVMKFAMSPLEYQCDPGFSKLAYDDPWTPVTNKFALTCKADGNLIQAPPCVNINDCLVRSCGDHGACVDNEVPTGTPFDDYRCHCIPGYEQTLYDSTLRPGESAKHCTNINDCPLEQPGAAGVCGGRTSSGARRGKCMDGVLGYSCVCGGGYKVAAVPGLPENQTCVPVICGTPPVVQHGTPTTTDELNFDSSKFTYNCDEGYAIDAKASGEKSFEVKCNHDATFLGMGQCLPVSCGQTPQVRFADRSPKQRLMAYPDVVTFSCEEGYSLDSKAGGVTSFKLTCMATGVTDGMQECKPVECGKALSDDHAFHDRTTVFVYPQTTDVQCNEGYSTDTTAEPEAAEYTLSCQSDGTFGGVRQCQRVSCGVPPKVQELPDMDMWAKADGIEHFYLDEAVVYTLDDGFSLNGEADGGKTFSIHCQSNAKFTSTRRALPVQCGKPPQLANCNYPGAPAELHFPQDAQYICDGGFSVDGKASGPKGFQTKCEAGGKYEKHAGCVPVQCGTVVIPGNTWQTGGPKVLVFPDTVSFKCEAGYSVNGRLSGATSLSTRCQAHGELTTHPGCKNMDDCEVDRCGFHGKCSDNAEPIGEHMRDFKCVCDSGFQEVIKPGGRVCENIPDCPKFACEPGSCHDLVNDYHCDCPRGYHEGPNKKTGLEHDCMPNVCGEVPSFTHATTRRSGIVDFADKPIDYSCERGYTLDERPGGTSKYSVKCLTDSTFQEAPPCLPVTCGIAEQKPNANNPGISHVFKEHARYTCKTGFSVDAQATGPKDFEVDCRSDGSYTRHPGCVPVECAVATPVKSSPLTMGVAKLVFKDVSNYECKPGYSINAKLSGPVSLSTRCQATGKMTTHFGCRNIDDCMGNTCGRGKCVDLEKPTGSHKKDYKCECDSGFEETIESDGNRICTNIPDCPKNACQPGTCGDLVNDYQCHCPEGYHEEANKKEGLEHDCMPNVCGTPPTVFFAKAGSKKTIDYAMRPVKYTCEKGYTLDSAPTGETTFAIACQSDTRFEDAPSCKPVSCGLAPPKINSLRPETRFVFKEKAQYNCNTGFSLDAQASGEKSFEVTCKADGSYEPHDGCAPVKCPVVIPPQSTLDGGHKQFVFANEAGYHCNAGFSTNGKVMGPITFTSRCQASGVFTTHPGCQNMDDCVGNQCGKHGKCVDLEKPAGQHKDDYKCVCDSGFEEKIEPSGIRTCVNIPDCPKEACEHGSCEDLVNDYKCHCFEGYHEEENKKVGLAHDCLPNVCGKPPSMPNAKAGTSASIDFAMPPVKYTCEKGYSLDSTAAGVATFEVACRADTTFDWAPVCMPVSCGEVPARPYSNNPLGVVRVFKQHARYTCFGGHSVDGKADGSKNFEVECQADGKYSAHDGCAPVECPVVSRRNAALAPGSAKFVFGDSATYECGKGHSTSGLMTGPTDFTSGCQANGELGAHMGCKNMDNCQNNKCGVHGKCSDLDDPTGVHVDDYKCICDSGFAEKIQNDGSRTCVNIPDCPTHACEPGQCQDLINDYKCHCPEGYHEDANEKEAFAHDCRPNICGSPPALHHATAGTSETIDFDMKPVVYTCDTGYSLDATAAGPKTFETSCQSDTTFQEAPTCWPVSCGELQAKVNSEHLVGVGRVFQQHAKYTCRGGFSVDAKASGSKEFDVKCQADGTYTSHNGCAPVECSVTTPAKSALAAGATKFVFSEKATFNCEKGYSTDGQLSGDTTFRARCQANGELAKHFGCKNMDDCFGNQCGMHGKCKDLDAPTGIHKDDYKCVCDSGFEEKILEDGVRTCVNIPDCPKDGCHLGHCEDLVNDYKCHCPEGYHEGENKKVGLPHDCLPNICGPPPSLQHAVAGTSEPIDFAMEPVLYKCAEGYSLNAQSSGAADFKIKCQSDTSFEEAPLCLPVTCGEAPSKDNANHPGGMSYVYNEEVQYTCDGGFSVDSKASGPKDFFTKCKADGTFEAHKGCSPVQCGAAVVAVNSLVKDAPQQLVFQDRAVFGCKPGYSVDATLAGLVTFSTQCQATGDLTVHNGCKNMDDCEGNLCVEHGKCVDVEKPSGVHHDDYKCKCDSGFEEKILEDGARTCKNIPDCPKDGCHLGSCEDLVNDYTCHCTEGYHEGENTKLGLAHDCLPNICGPPPTLQHAEAGTTEAIDFAMEPVSYKCAKGYTLNAQPGGAVDFPIKCLSDTSFEEAPQCLPVMCGEAPTKGNADHPVGISFVFNQDVQYTCAGGFSVDSKASGAKDFSTKCQADGSFDAHDGCAPVQCGPVAVAVNSLQKDGPQQLVFGDRAVFGCKTGYSVDATLSGPVTFITQCQATGDLTVHNGCKNMDNCEGNLCGAHGTCVDAEQPTGVHKDDYKCVCETGFEELIGDDGTRICGNVPDCPEGACLPGSCQDLVNDYKCMCPEGYHVGKNAKKGLDHDCLPNVCGIPLTVDHATVSSSKKMHFAMDPVQYTCDKGYSLDGAPTGDTTFRITCLADSTFEVAPACLPVTCGVTPQKAHATHSAGSHVFPEKAAYSCAKGFSVNGKATGAMGFEVACKANGEYAAHDGCAPIGCSVVTPVNSKLSSGATKFVFGDDALFRCKAGYSINSKLVGQVSFSTACLASGEFDSHIGCSNMDDCETSECGTHGKCEDAKAPTGEHIKDYKCVCESGFEEIIKPEGTRTCENKNDCPISACSPGSCEDLVNDYKCHCPVGFHEAANEKTGLKHDCVPNICGVPPQVKHAKTDVRTAVDFTTKPVKYSCEDGYTLDGSAVGDTTFQVGCQADTSFSLGADARAGACKPVSCGMQPQKAMAGNPGAAHVFKENAAYTCAKGFSVTGKSTGPTAFEVACQADGTYASHKGCAPIGCPVVTPANSKLSSGAAAHFVFGTNATFRCKAGYSINGKLAGQVSFSTSCLASGEFSPHVGCSNMNDCEVSECGTHGKCVDAEAPTGEHSKDYKCVCESGFEEKIKPEGTRTCENKNDCPNAACEPGNCEDLVHDYKCNCPVGFHMGANPKLGLKHDCVLNICGVPPRVENAKTEVSTVVDFGTEPVKYTCVEGHTVDGSPTGDSTFRVACQADTTFESAPGCLPVSCGAAPQKVKSSHPGLPHVFQEKAQYTCAEGHSVDAKVTGPMTFEVTCQADGFYTAHDGCAPVQCALALPAHTKLAQGPTEFSFGDDATFRCNPGYATNGKVVGPVSFSMPCLASGEFSPHSGCTNKDDCEANQCGPHGKCVDLDTPTGVHKDDYKCACDSGFEEIIGVDGGRSCQNIPNCPKGIVKDACDPGSCQDLVNDYKCHCPGGYEEAKNDEKGWAHDCMPKSCGKPPNHKHATTGISTAVVFTSEPVEYNCAPGYTLDGAASGITSFTTRCQADEKFEAAPACVPVACGVPPQKGNAAHRGNAHVFKEHAHYSCTEGYSVDGKLGGSTDFQVECQADGTYDLHEGCEPIECAVVAPANSALAEGPHMFVFGESATFRCNPGYAVNGKLMGPSSVTTACLSTGELATHDGCTNIDDCEGNQCGKGKCVDAATPTGVHKDDYKCVCDSGFKEDFNAAGMRICEDIPDCPVDTCQPGSCEDLVNDYKCACPPGYHEAENAKEELAHDCFPNVCGAPPKYEYAQVHDEDIKVVDFASDVLLYTCDHGYTQDQAPAAGITNTEFAVRCTEGGDFFAETQGCRPVACGLSPQKANVLPSGVGGEHWFGDKAEYTCSPGFGVADTGHPTKFEVDCQADGFYAPHAGCVPRVCDVSIPAKSTLVAGPEQYVFGDNATFACNPGYSTNGEMVGAVSFERACLKEGELAKHDGCINKDDCEDNQCGEHGKCADNEKPTGVHKNDYKCVCDSGFKEDIKSDGTRTCENIADCPMVDACGVGTCEDLINDFKCHCPEGYHGGELSHDCLPKVCGLPPSVAHATTGVKDKQHFESDPIESNCMEGFTLDGAPTGEDSFIISCQSSGSFEPAQECLPVSCGVTPQKPNAKSSSSNSHIFEEQTEYTCADGYSATGKAAGPKFFQLTCRADGTYTPHAGCKPVECGRHSTHDTEKAVQTEGSQDLVFGGKAFFECIEGHSTDGKMDGIVTFATSCQADGQLTALPQCKNIDNCQGNQCGPEGKCVDAQDPTGVHKNDYKCVCNPGFEEKMNDAGVRTCENINDCPLEACGMGECEDLLNDYKCHCVEGYHEARNPKMMLDHDCLPNACGMPPAIEHAAPASTRVLDFSMPPVEYMCGKGYTLDGSAAGDTTFEVTCLAKQSFDGARKCLPVACGAAPAVVNAKFEESKIYKFPEQAGYDCKKGYTIDGKAAGTANFAAVCTSAGTFDKVLACQPVACPAVPAQAHASFDDAVVLVYPMTVEVVCEDGFKSGGSQNYEVSCGSDGQLVSPEHACAAIDCGTAPEVAFATVEGSTIFGEKLVATAQKGYTLDGSPDGASTFEIRCQKTGSFSRVKTFQRVSCGPAPDLVNAMDGVIESAAGAASLSQTRAIPSRPQGRLLTALTARQHLEVHRQASADSAYFGDTVKYQCDEGYHADSNRDGIATVDEAKELTFTCAKNGDVEAVGPSACLPVTCPVFRLDSSLPTLPLFEPEAEAGQVDYVYLENSPLEELEGRDDATTSIKSLEQWRQPSYATAEGACTLNENCNAFCWNAADMTTYYPSIQQGFRQVDVHQKGQGFKCFKKVARVSPSKGYQFMYNDKDHVLYGRDNKDVVLKDLQKQGIAKDKAIDMCSGESDCDAFCWNPDDASFFYKEHDKGVATMPPSDGSGTGWMCYKKTYVSLAKVNEWQAFTCAAGFSVDATPAGAQSFSEVCQSDGKLSSDASCKPIDWCSISQCGKDGDCVNGHLGYTCDCKEGFQASLSNEGMETCEQVDECDVLGGTMACTMNGKCVDGLSEYKCECDAGYEVSTGAEDLEECTPVVCGAAPSIPHATAPEEGQKISFPGVVDYTCAVGYTLDGHATGANDFSVSCEASRILSGKQQCKPIDCGLVGKVDNAKADKGSLTFGQSATYTCDVGHETGSGLRSFSVSCSETGVLSAATELCEPVSCGRPDKRLFASFNNAEVFFPNKVAYTCNEGYTTTGQAAGAATFQVTCHDTKELKETSLLQIDQPFRDSYDYYEELPPLEAPREPTICMPISCGVPARVPFTEGVPHTERFYMDQFQVFCDSGFTVDGTSGGEATFTAKCAKTGNYENLQTCKRVSCGVPAELEGSLSTDPEKLFEESATWTCKDGYSTDGKKTGNTKFAKMCTANGVFGDSSPSDCLDIDFCYGQPCGFNGVCTDLGDGIVGPGYECTCGEGFETIMRPDGTPTCKADDCEGDPCGIGGACTDLSKATPPGPQGQYSCDCLEGYRLHGHDGKYTCTRASCGVLPEVHHLDKTYNLDGFMVKTFSGKPAQMDSFYNRPHLESFDVVSLVCADGYSTDGSIAPESKSFSLECEGSGRFARPIKVDAECQPVRCDNMMLPILENGFVVTLSENFFEYGDSVDFQCLTGYTIDGQAGGEKKFQLPCQKTGKFSHDHPHCHAVGCGKPPALPDASSSTGNDMKFGDSVTYACSTGFEIDRTNGDDSFTGSCTADGSFAWGAGSATTPPVCKRISCGTLPTYMKAFPDNSTVVPDPMLYHDVVTVHCLPGHYIGGSGVSSFSIRCKGNGELTDSPGVCINPLEMLNGEVTDAQSGSVKLKGANLIFTKDGASVATATSDSSGRFTVNVPKGLVTVSAALDGFITKVKTINVQGPIDRGQGADVALSRNLLPGQWRATLTWQDNPEDLDSHTFFGDKFSEHVYYPDDARVKTAPGTGGIEVVLDRDDINSYGPETTSFYNIGHCEGLAKCLIRFRIKKFFGTSTLGDAHPIVTVYKGDRVEAKFTVNPEQDPGEKLYTVFTLDGARPKVYAGAWKVGPNLGSRQYVANWYGSLDSQQWSKVPTGTLMTGIMRNAEGEGVHAIEEGRYSVVRGTTGMDCVTQGWWNSFDHAGWSTCPEGYYMSGIYRSGSASDRAHGIEQIQEASCCKPQELPSQWGSCTDDNPVFGEGAAAEYDYYEESEAGQVAECPAGKAMVGLFRSDDSTLNGIQRMKCCSLPEDLIPADVSYILGEDGANTCPQGSTKIRSLGECKTAVEALNINKFSKDDANSGHMPGGCYKGLKNTGNFNTKSGGGKTDRKPICKKATR
jgi:hypothetical protein